jgi:hypothetical protein
MIDLHEGTPFLTNCLNPLERTPYFNNEISSIIPLSTSYTKLNLLHQLNPDHIQNPYTDPGFRGTKLNKFTAEKNAYFLNKKLQFT